MADGAPHNGRRSWQSRAANSEATWSSISRHPPYATYAAMQTLGAARRHQPLAPCPPWPIEHLGERCLTGAASRFLEADS